MDPPVGDPPLAWLVRRPWAWVTLPILVGLGVVAVSAALVLVVVAWPFCIAHGWLWRHARHGRRRRLWLALLRWLE